MQQCFEAEDLHRFSSMHEHQIVGIGRAERDRARAAERRALLRCEFLEVCGLNLSVRQPF